MCFNVDRIKNMWNGSGGQYEDSSLLVCLHRVDW